jgi:hypothetical protein
LKVEILPVPLDDKEMVVSEFDQFIVLLGTEELKFIPLTA